MRVVTTPSDAEVERLAREVIAAGDRSAAVDAIVERFVAKLAVAMPALRPGPLRSHGERLGNRISAMVGRLDRTQRIVTVARDEGGRR